MFYVKVSNDPESKPFPVQSRDSNAMAGCITVCTNLGKDLRLGNHMAHCMMKRGRQGGGQVS